MTADPDQAKAAHPVLHAAAMGGLLAGPALALLLGSWWWLLLSLAMFVGTAVIAGFAEAIAEERGR